MKSELYNMDCLDKLKELEENSLDSIVTDPPYGLSFMGKKWDYDVPSQEIWEECLRVLKPGGYLLSFAGSRTYHRMAVRIEDAGFEIRDQIMWIYSTGFPKSHNVGKSIDKLQGNEREEVGERVTGNALQKTSKTGEFADGKHGGTQIIKETKGNSKWEGWGSALKPAHEPIVMARKKLSEKTIASNVLKWGCGGINIDGSRVKVDKDNEPRDYSKENRCQDVNYKIKKVDSVWNVLPERNFGEGMQKTLTQGRFPANIIIDGSDEVLAGFPESKVSGAAKNGRVNIGGKDYSNTNNVFGGGVGKKTGVLHNDSGSAARFFYCAKASKSDRNEGLEEFEKKAGGSNAKGYTKDVAKGVDRNRPVANFHPTVKPTKLMQYLIKLVTPTNGTCLDPFMGSGSTGKAAKMEGFNFIGIEREEEYFNIAKARIDNTKKDKQLNLF